MNFQLGRQLVAEWLDKFEGVLHPQSAVAGLLGHSTEIGDAREFFVEKVLSSFLPSSLGIGRGSVIAADARQSRQVDIVIYDKRFPALCYKDGRGLYLIESVLATIEVKSELSELSLCQSLDNCLSVMEMPATIVAANAERLWRRLRRQLGRDDLVADEISRRLVPRTYIFGLKGLHEPERLRDFVTGWCRQTGYRGTPNRPFLPSVIATGGCIGITWGDPVRLRGGRFEQEGREAAEDKVDPFMMFWHSEQRLGWLANHLLYAVEQRMMLENRGAALRRSIESYFAFEDYFTRNKPDQPKYLFARVRNDEVTM